MLIDRPADTLADAAWRWYAAGFCVVPSHQDGSKRPHTAWAKYQQERPDFDQVADWLETGDYSGIGVICGQVSLGVEMLEIEGPAVAAGAIDALFDSARQYGCQDLLVRVFSGCAETSAGGGLHLFIRVQDEIALPNTKLALDQDNRVLAETRGEGGFVIVAPTPARTGHEPASSYEFLTRGPEATAEVTGEERDVLHTLFTLTLDDRPVPDLPPTLPPADLRDGDSPGDRYMDATTWDDLLVPEGWTKVQSGTRQGHPVEYWRRPGKSDGISATTGGPGDHLYVFSSSTPFPIEQPLSRFAAFAVLHHHGDFRAAARDLAAQGYSSDKNPVADLLAVFEPQGGPEEVLGAENTPEGSRGLGGAFSDLSWVLTGERREPPEAEFLHVDAGHALFYRGRINGMFGDPETAKSWIAQSTIAQALTRGNTAVYLDIDHNGAPEIAHRLMLMGSEPTHIADPDRFRVYEPEDRNGLAAFLEDMRQFEPDIVVVDSLGELIPMLGMKSVDNDELTQAIRAVLKPLAHTLGACVITIDHLPKSQEARGSGYAIGGMAKKRAVDGLYLSCESIDPPAPGQTGKIRLTIEKDRHGQVRKHATGRIAGDYIIDSTDPTFTNTHIEQPAISADGKLKPTSAMRAVAVYLMDLDGWTAPSRNNVSNSIQKATSYKKHTLDRAIDQLASEHYIIIDEAGPGKANPVRLVKPYQEDGLTDATEVLR